MHNPINDVPDAPGCDPHWTSSAKDGVGTAHSSSSKLWFTLSHGIINELYFPHVDSPNTRDLQFLITDGESFCHEEKRDLDHQTEYPEQNALFFRVTNTEGAGRYRIVKEILGEAHSSVLLLNTRVEILEPALRGKLKLYALLAPHLKGTARAARRCPFAGLMRNTCRWCAAVKTVPASTGLTQCISVTFKRRLEANLRCGDSPINRNASRKVKRCASLRRLRLRFTGALMTGGRRKMWIHATRGWVLGLRTCRRTNWLTAIMLYSHFIEMRVRSGRISKWPSNEPPHPKSSSLPP